MQKPEEFLPTLIDETAETTIVYQEEICSEELAVEKAVREACKKAKIQTLWGSTLYHLEDLPFHPVDLPHIYGKFRERTQEVKVRDLLPEPKKGDLPFIKSASKQLMQAASFLPDLRDFGFSQEEIKNQKDDRSYFEYKGGEDHGLKRCQDYIFQNKAVGNYANTRN